MQRSLLVLLAIIHLSFAQESLNAQQSPVTNNPKQILFTPKVFHREFSATAVPALTIHAGDTITTESVDAVGFDKKGTSVTQRGNPLTGPFYIEGAMPGDVIAITITQLSLNRDYATTLGAFVPKMVSKKVAKQTWRSAKLFRWTLDREKMIGTPQSKTDHLQALKVPLHPFLGCIGVAPAGDKGTSTSDSGPFGGNMDFSYNTKGATIYLPVFHPGALLFMGDGHAAQGDGELNGDALETSMEFTFTVQIIKQAASKLPTPMLEDADHWMVIGIEKTLDESVKTATMKLSAWLQQVYGLSLLESSQVIGPSVEFRIPKVAATKVEVAGMLKKEVLSGLKRIGE